MTTYAPRTMTAAGNKAKSLVGKANRVGYCLAECVRTVYGIMGPYHWGGNGRAWAINYWLSAVSRGKVVKTNDPNKVPFGAMAFFDSARNRPEHVVIGAGGGYCYSTDFPRTGRWGKVKIRSIEASWGMKLVGYILVTGDGVTLTDKKKAVNPKDPAAYFLGAEGSYITDFGKHLVAKGFGKHYKVGPGPVFGEADRLNVVDVQHALGFTGDDADGYPGETSLAYILGPDTAIERQLVNPNAMDQGLS